MLAVQNFEIAFSKAMPEAFRVTLFNGSRDNDGTKEERVFIGRVSIAQLVANHLVLFLLCHVSNCQIVDDAQHCASLHSVTI